ncbi:MAG: hypothetical protein QOI29_3208, partial [Mycobacterium sp.]|nr:hypothetical protein [Mycobacterium sp.]
WAGQYPRLDGAHRLIALDLPGFGCSARAPEPTTLAVLAARSTPSTFRASGVRCT